MAAGLAESAAVLAAGLYGSAAVLAAGLAGSAAGLAESAAVLAAGLAESAAVLAAGLAESAAVLAAGLAERLSAVAAVLSAMTVEMYWEGHDFGTWGSDGVKENDVGVGAPCASTCTVLSLLTHFILKMVRACINHLHSLLVQSVCTCPVMVFCWLGPLSHQLQ